MLFVIYGTVYFVIKSNKNNQIHTKMVVRLDLNLTAWHAKAAVLFSPIDTIDSVVLQFVCCGVLALSLFVLVLVHFSK